MDISTALFVAAALALTFLCKRLLEYTARLDSQMVQPFQLSLEDPNSLEPLPCPSLAQPATKALSIIVPAYNEEDRLPATLEETLSYLQKRRNRAGPSFTYEVIVVDDGSKDGTARVTFDFVRKHGIDAVRLLRMPRNCGKGMAVREGMMIARGAYCLFMDADGATRVSDLELLEKALQQVQTPSFGGKRPNAEGAKPSDERGPVGVAVGSRAHMEQAAIAKRTWLRNFLMHGFHMLVTFVAGGAIKDTQCGFKLFTRRAALACYSNQRLQRWCFDVELLYLCHYLGVPVTEVQVNWTEMPGSKIRFTSILHMAFELSVLKVAYQWLGLWHVHTETDVKNKTA